MKKTIKIFCVALFALLVACGFTAFADDTVFFVNETFDNLADGELPSWVNQYGGTNERQQAQLIYGAYTVSEDNKALLLGRSNVERVLTLTTAKSFGNSFVMSVDYMPGEKCLGIVASVEGASGNFAPYMIKDNKILNCSSVQIGSLSKNKFTNITVVFDVTNRKYDLYIDGKLTVSKDSLYGTLTTPQNFRLFPFDMSEESEMFVDNLRIYSGNKIRTDFEKTEFNTKITDYMPFTRQVFDFAYLNSKYLYDDTQSKITGYQSYVTYSTNGNQILLNRFLNNMNKDRENDYIEMKKTTVNGNCEMYIRFYWNKNARYYSASVDISSDTFPGEARILSCYGYKTVNGVRTTYKIADPVVMTQDGELVSTNGQTIGRVAPGAFTNVALAIDATERTIDVYVDDVLKVKGIKIPDEFYGMYDVRMSIESKYSNGNLTLDNFKVIQLSKPYVAGKAYQTVGFTDNEEFVKYLKDKIALSGFSGEISVDGVKSELGIKPFMYDDKYEVVYVGGDALNAAFGIDAKTSGNTLSGDGFKAEAGNFTVELNGREYTLDNAPILKDGEVLVSFTDIAKKVFGKYVVTDGYGLVLVSDYEVKVDRDNEREPWETSYMDGWDTPLLALHKYMLYDRPSTEVVAQTVESADDSVLSMHPRIGITASDIEVMKEKRTTDERLDRMITSLIKKADNYIKKETLPNFQFSQSIRAYNTIEFLPLATKIEAFATAYWFTGEQKYVDAAWRQMEETFTWPQWNQAHSLDLGRIMTAYGLAYDWMYDGFTPEQRKTILDKTYELAVIPTIDSYYQITGNPTGNAEFKYKVSNFNCMSNGGLFTFAMAVIGDASDEQKEILCDGVSCAVRSMEVFLQAMIPGGGWPESAFYWKEHKFLAIGLLALNDTLGTTFSLEDSPGLRETTDWFIAMNGPLYANNFHDSPTDVETLYNTDVYCGIALFAKLYDGMEDEVAWRFDQLEKEAYSNLSVFDLLGYSLKVGDADNLPLDNYTPGISSFASKGSVTDWNELYLSSHAGMVTGAHAQPDVGTFVFDILGERWATDLGSENYYDKATATQQGNSDNMYRDRTESHNVMLFNPSLEKTKGTGSDQLYRTYTELDKYESKSKGAFVIYDMTEPYSNEVSDYHRGIMSSDDRRSAIIRDEFTVLKENTEALWLMTTKADVEVTKDGCMLSQNGKRVKMEIDTDALSYEIYTTAAEGFYGNENYGYKESLEKDNSEYTRIVVEMKVNDSAYINVRLYPMDEGLEFTKMYNVPLSKWSVPDGERSEREKLGVKEVFVNGYSIQSSRVVSTPANEKMPEITVSLEDPSLKYEIFPASDINGSTIVRVYSTKIPGYYKDTEITYKDGKLIKTNVNAFESYMAVASWEMATHSTVVDIDYLDDENIETRWGCANLGDYACLDYGEPVYIEHFAAAYWEGAQRAFTYEIYVSNDAANWKLAASVQSSGMLDAEDGYEIIDVEPVTARYVKIVNSGGNTKTNSLNIFEFKTLGKTIK